MGYVTQGFDGFILGFLGFQDTLEKAQGNINAFALMGNNHTRWAPVVCECTKEMPCGTRALEKLHASIINNQ